MNDELQPILAELAVLRNRLSRAEEQLSQVDTPWPRLFLAKEGDSSVQWQEQAVNAGEIGEFPDGRNCTDDGDPGALIDPEDAFFIYEYQDIVEGGKVTRAVKVVGSGFIPVDVTTDGGDGDATPFSYTFTRKSGGDPLGTLAAPEWVYEPNVKVLAATNGTAYQTAAGVWTLYQVDEVPDDSDCPPPP